MPQVVLPGVQRSRAACWEQPPVVRALAKSPEIGQNRSRGSEPRIWVVRAGNEVPAKAYARYVAAGALRDCDRVGRLMRGGAALRLRRPVVGTRWGASWPLGEQCAPYRLPNVDLAPANRDHFVRGCSRRTNPVIPAYEPNSRFCAVYEISGDGGNRTRVHDRVLMASTSVAGALISSEVASPAGLLGTSPLKVSPIWRRRGDSDKPAF